MRKAYLILSTIITLASVGFGFWQFSLTKKLTEQAEFVNYRLELSKNIQQKLNSSLFYAIKDDYEDSGRRKRDKLVFEKAVAVKENGELLLNFTQRLLKDIKIAQSEQSPKFRYYDFLKTGKLTDSTTVHKIHQSYLHFSESRKSVYGDSLIIETLNRNEFAEKWLMLPNTSMLFSSILGFEAEIISEEYASLEYLSKQLGGGNFVPNLRVKRVYFTYY
jgi:hypothetical protein